MPKVAVAMASTAARRHAYRVLAAAADTIGISPNDLLYARVDLAETGSDEYVLLELELVEPSLFLLHAPEAPGQYADELMVLLR